MKIAITSTGQDLTSQIDPRFGRSPYFIFIDPETMQFEAIENPNVNAMGGAGIQTAQLIANKGVEVILTGSCGPNAFQTLQAAGVKVIVGVVGTINEAIEKYKSGGLKPTAGPNVGSHFGMGSTGAPPGTNPGVGMGMGRGMGMGYGIGPMPQYSQPPGSPQPTKEQELQMLRQQVDSLKQQLDMINNRIKELENKK
ncbi:dinitrogenase iron-molybdenum cofactor biosynthesis protein [candidate division WOR-3 bacterium]|nr:dinitrogenase iron-molybdenum cofactor biosynthesis protein [candidate division WOR-3 bacterium]